MSIRRAPKGSSVGGQFVSGDGVRKSPGQLQMEYDGSDGNDGDTRTAMGFEDDNCPLCQQPIDYCQGHGEWNQSEERYAGDLEPGDRVWPYGMVSKVDDQFDHVRLHHVRLNIVNYDGPTDHEDCDVTIGADEPVQVLPRDTHFSDGRPVPEEPMSEDELPPDEHVGDSWHKDVDADRQSLPSDTHFSDGRPIPEEPMSEEGLPEDPEYATGDYDHPDYEEEPDWQSIMEDRLYGNTEGPMHVDDIIDGNW